MIDPQKEVNEKELEEKFLKPNFFIIIPAPVMGDKELSDSEKLLYGVLLSLTSKLGYCFASDKYLSNETGVCIKEIQKRVKKLEDRGHIKRETQKDGFIWKRKIYCVSNNFYEGDIRRPRDNPPAASETPARRPYKDTYINSGKVVVCSKGGSATPADPEGSSLHLGNFFEIEKIINGQEAKITINDIFYYSIRTKKNWTTDEIEKAWIVLAKYEGHLYDYFAFIEGTIRNFRMKAQVKAMNKKTNNNKESKCNTQNKKSTNTKDNTSDHSTKEQVSPKSETTLMEAIYGSNDGWKNRKVRLSSSDHPAPEKPI